MAEALNYDTKREANQTPDRQVRRWLLEIKLSQKREKDWRKTAQTIWKRYRAKARKKDSFNILWANTETLRPALYNSPPKPDVRRRFRQGDMLGKAVGELLERSLTYCGDAYDLDEPIKQDVLDALLPGRGLSRVRYVPKFKQISENTQAESSEPSENSAPPLTEAAEQPHDEEPFEGEREEVEYEQCLCEHVQWDDFLHGPGKTWNEVTWISFRHRLTRDDLIEQFGEVIGKEIKLDATDDEDIQKKENEDLEDVFKRAEVWEIWDKDEEQVFFLAASYKKGLIYPIQDEGETEKGEPPLKLRNFFPIPRPLYLIEDTGSLVPTPLYELYREQAEELDRVSGRINLIVNACRVRFAFDPSLTELSEMMTKGDNEGVPVENARAWINNGGLEKAIWWMPIEQLVAVLKVLYEARELCKSTIYELTGISDIVRGETDPNETLGAQQLKANYSSIRLQRMQKEVQRYVRDLIRLMAEVIGENFSGQTLSKMTGMNFPTAVQKQQMGLQLQAMMQGAPGQSPQLQAMQNAMQMPTWEEIMAVLQSDLQREFRVDVETNSTIAETLSQDMTGLREVLTGIVQFWEGVGPAVQAGAVSIEAVKAITMSIVRRARMGLEVEDALETGMQAPKPQSDPNAAKAQAEQMKSAHEAEIAQREQAHEQQIAQREQQLEEAKALAEHQREQDQAAHQQQIENMQNDRQDAFNRWKVIQDNLRAIRVAEIAAGSVISKAQIEAANATEQDTNAALADDGQAGEQAAKTAAATTKKRAAPIDKLAQMHTEQMQAHQKSLEAHGKTAEAIGALAQAVANPKPRKVIRGLDGRMAGVQ